MATRRIPLMLGAAAGGLLLAGAGTAPALRSAALDLGWFTVDGGGSQSAGGALTLQGTIGQPDAGEMTGGTLSLRGGFQGGGGVIVTASPGLPEVPASVPLTFRMHAPRPSPFRSTSQVAFDLPAAGTVSLEIFDVTGRRVRALVDGPLRAGSHALSWNGRDDHGSDVASGVYFVVLNAGGETARTKLVRLQ